MINALKIVVTLTLVVVLSSLAVYLVEEPTSKEIARIQAEAIIEAYEEVFPAISGTDTTELSTLDFAETGIIEATVITDNSDTLKGVIYTASFRGFSSEIIYIIGVDKDGNITGYKTLSQNDTAGYGSQIADEENWTQFPGMLLQTAGEGSFDGLSGATITTTAWKASFEALYNFHKDNFPVPVLTPEQILFMDIKKIVPENTTLASYTPTYAFASYGIKAVYVANDGTSDVAVVYHVEFIGFSTADVNEFIISFDLATNNVIDFMALYSGDTVDYGADIMFEEHWTQFAGKTPADLVAGSIDGISGATVTTDAWKISLQNLTIYHQAEFQGIVVLTPEEQFEVYKQDLFPTATRYEDITEFKAGSPVITQILDAYDDTDTYLGTIYFATTIGASYSGLTYIQFLVGIDNSNNFTGFFMFDDTDTTELTEAFYESGYGDSLDGAIDGEFGIDAVSGSTITYDKLSAAIATVADYHLNKYYVRPDSINIDDEAELISAFPTAVSFLSVYEDYEFNTEIGNIYEAYDGADTLLGYVYVGVAEGHVSDIIFTWGVDLTGTTQAINIVSGEETWMYAQDYGNYNGSDGNNFMTSSWLDNFEGVTFASLLTTQVDGVANVSTTTDGMIAATETIAEYHSDQSVGGAG
jgi:electron transport complex protein RnfG